MPTDAPDGRINSHVVQGRRPDHVDPKTPRVKTAEPKADKADDNADKPADKKADDKSPTPKAPAKE